MTTIVYPSLEAAADGLVTHIRAAMDAAASGGAPLIVALDGRCAAGKTTMAAAVARRLREGALRVQVVHLDDFFLRPEQRTEERLATPGENIDHERFLAEILLPLSKNQPVVYRAYDCSVQALGEPIALPAADVVLAEGSYSCHRALWDYYGLRWFVDVAPAVQQRRILTRNGERMLRRFVEEWIPKEEAYHAAQMLRTRCDAVICIEEHTRKREEA